MKAILICFFFIFLAISACLNAQTVRPFVVQAGDTIRCKSIAFRYSRHGLLEFAQYVDTMGNEVHSETEQGLPTVTTIYKEGKTFDRVPIYPAKHDSPIWYAPRMADGKIKLYLTNTTYVYSTAGSLGGYYRFTFQLPDGTFYKVTQGNVNKFVKPLAQQCKNFMEAYKGNYKADEYEFYRLVTIYNAQCK